MAFTDRRGFVDDGSADITIGGALSVIGSMTSSAGSFGEISTYGNFSISQTLVANTWTKINHWLTASLASPTIIAISGTNAITASAPGLFLHMCSLSFSGAAGTYTFSIFNNSDEGFDSTSQTTINVGQSYPRNISIFDLDYHGPELMPMGHDVRVKSSNGGTFIMNYGTLGVVRVIG